MRASSRAFSKKRSLSHGRGQELQENYDNYPGAILSISKCRRNRRKNRSALQSESIVVVRFGLRGRCKRDAKPGTRRLRRGKVAGAFVEFYSRFSEGGNRRGRKGGFERRAPNRERDFARIDGRAMPFRSRVAAQAFWWRRESVRSVREIDDAR